MFCHSDELATKNLKNSRLRFFALFRMTPFKLKLVENIHECPVKLLQIFTGD